jgi:hypothetical protein
MTALTDGPVFHVEPQGWLGSRMIQYMVGLTFRHLVPGSRISNVQIPEWDIDHPPISLREPIGYASHRMHVEMAGLTERARAGEVRSIVYTGYGQRMENFLDADFYRPAFRAPVVSPVRFGERYLVCHVHADDAIFGTLDPNYPLTPVEFYANIVAETGLIPVFMGQTAPNAYTDRLRERFPLAVFLDEGDPVLDFETIRQAKNIVIGVSVYAWLAAWLSHADRVFMAVSGLMNPMQHHIVDLLPFGDPRYRFYLFPINYAVPFERHAASHQRIASLWRLMPHDLLRRLLREAPRFDPPVEQMLGEFDADYYLATNDDVAATVGRDNADGARKHYQVSGVREHRLPFRLSPTWYAARYPMAAFEVAQGDYSSFAHHYVAVGRTLGYRPLPDASDRALGWDAGVDDPATLMSPSIAMLANEVVLLEKTEPLGTELEVSLGDSFAKLLPPRVVEQFTRREATAEVRAYRLRNVVLDTSMMALFNGRQPIPETMYMMNQRDYEYALVKPLYPEHTDPTRHYILGCNASAHNYYHWMTQSLPAIDWGLRNRRHPNVALALPPLQPWQEESLALLGHAGVPRLRLRPSAHYGLASAEYAEFLGSRMASILSRAAAATYARLRQAVAPAPDGADEIYVARTDAANRIATNEAGLITMLAQQGVRIVVPGTLPVTQQIAIFRRARLVIGPHGAGLSNIMGCEPGSHLYELVPSHYPNLCFNRLAQGCGLHYWGDVFPGEAGEGNPHDRSWHIDLDVVAARLKEIRARIATTMAYPG